MLHYADLIEKTQRAEPRFELCSIDASNLAYIVVHRVSGIGWKHCKHLLPEHVVDAYMKAWQDVECCVDDILALFVFFALGNVDRSCACS
jgi:hypothetical protein